MRVGLACNADVRASVRFRDASERSSACTARIRSRSQAGQRSAVQTGEQAAVPCGATACHHGNALPHTRKLGRTSFVKQRMRNITACAGTLMPLPSTRGCVFQPWPHAATGAGQIRTHDRAAAGAQQLAERRRVEAGARATTKAHTYKETAPEHTQQRARAPRHLPPSRRVPRRAALAQY